MDMYNPNYRSEKFENDKSKFENLDLKKTVSDIYYSSTEKAFEANAEDIEKNRKHFLEISYTKEQAQEKFNYYTDEIRIKNEDDNCYYRLIKNEILKNSIEFPVSIKSQKELIIFELCRHIKEDILHYSYKLEFIADLPQQIYKSNKIHRQFLFFKELANETIGDNSQQTNANRTDIAYYCYYTSQTKTLEIDNIFPSDKAWDEIGKKFSKHPKNIQTVYNLIVSNKAVRLNKTKIKNIEFVIENLLNNKPEALKLAKTELDIAYLNS